MFTFVRVFANRLGGLGADQVLCARLKAPDPVDQTEQTRSTNPWEKDLKRLANVHEKGGSAASKSRPNTPSVLRPQRRDPRVISGRLTPPNQEGSSELKSWWGKSICPYTPTPTDLASILGQPPPSKRKNPWTDS